ncbi:MAG: methylated-DNA-[protein]-cysteine S-methyltransferase [Acidobacteria bacterium]|jgi:methylated-DNA-[protein]-cysteine S-methyltransferase|nr:methylated-DNA-[protein]-cysteine S-methyltransferase [Acidobacteriota bacterium]
MDYAWEESPVGRLLIAGDGEGLRFVQFAGGRAPVQPEPGWREDPAALEDALRQLREYFAGTRRAFDLRLAPEGTPFQQRVWHELRSIPYGGTVTYGELARRVGCPNGSRAVGLANGANPLSIVVPCHRVIGAGGALVGYGGGLGNKEWLLAHERVGRERGER